MLYCCLRHYLKKDAHKDFQTKYNISNLGDYRNAIKCKGSLSFSVLNTVDNV